MAVQPAFYAIAAGVASHLIFFIRGEHHLQAATLSRLYLAIAGILFLGDLTINQDGFNHAILSILYLGAYGLGLFSSVIIYRLCFHRLANFPGPILARATKLWHTWKVLDAKQHLLLHSLHLQYGDFVRTGPNEITVFRPEAPKAIHGYGSRCTKSAWYDNLKPYTAMNTTRIRSEHDQRRRLYEKGLSVKAIQGYEYRVMSHARQLDDAFGRLVGNPINITTWFQYFGFDVMGELGFGRSFNQIKTAQPHFETDFLREGMSLLATVTPVPWMYHLALRIPGVTKDWQALLSWSAEQAKQKIKEPAIEGDIMSWIIDDWLSKDERDQKIGLLGGDAIAVVIAGSQTVAVALIFIFYRLAKHQEWAEKIHAEIRTKATLEPSAFPSMTFLNAFINETLRLHPPVPSAGLRNTPQEGIWIGEQYIPGNVTVLTPNYSLGRLDSCFERANEFLPERWCTEPQLVKNSTGFRPFGLGPYSCVGKNLALLEVRTVMVILIMKYRISFAPGEDCSIMFGNLKDVFTVSPGKCELIFEPRVRRS